MDLRKETNYMNEESTSDEIDIKDLLYIVFEKKFLILGLGILMAICGYIFTNITYEDIFVADASMVINSKQAKIINGEITLNNDIYLSQKMVNTYRVILVSDNVLSKVNSEINEDIALDQMRAWINVSSPKDTEVIMVEVKHSDVELAVDIANAIMKVAPDVISDTVEVGSINVIDYATVVNNPIAAKANLNIAIGGVLGIMMGVFIAFIIAMLFPKVKNKNEINKGLLLNVIAEIPKVEKPKKEGRTPLIVDKNVDSSFVEAYKLMALQVQHLTSETGYKKYLITSACESEGKTTVSLNLGLALAYTGASVVLVEGDNHKPRVLKRAGLRQLPVYNICDFINGTVELKECILKVEKANLDILPSLKKYDSEDKYFSDEKFKKVLNELDKDYDFIIIDSPPAFIISDTAIMTKSVDAVILTIRQEQTNIEVIKDTRDNLQSIGANIVGSVLNDIRKIGADNRYKYKYKYGYNYDLPEKQKPKHIYLPWIWVVLWSVIIFVFASQDGNRVIELSYRFSEYLISIAERFNFIDKSTMMENGKSAGLSTYGDTIKYISKHMENFIHTCLFFVMGVISIAVLKKYKIPKILLIAYTVIITMGVSLLNESYQSFFIEERIFEIVDIAYAFIGMLLSFFICIPWLFKSSE